MQAVKLVGDFIADLFKIEKCAKNKIIWSDEQIKYIIDSYKNGTSGNKLGKEFKVSGESIRTLLKNQGIATRRYIDINRKYARDSNYFDKIDTQDKAYWLGFLYADGCVREDRNTLRLGLSIEDESHLEKFKNSLGSNAPIKYSQKIVGSKKFIQAFVSIGDKHLVTSLAEKGCIQNKSLLLKFPTEDIVPNDLNGHFIRGYFDGDGSIHIGKTYKNTNHKNYRISFIGSKFFIPMLQETLGVAHLKIENKGKYYQFSIYGNLQCLRILDKVIYKDAGIYLNRKYQKYIEFKEFVKQSEATKVENLKNMNRLGKQCKITKADADEIRTLYASGTSVKELIEKFNIGNTQVYRIIHRERWA